MYHIFGLTIHSTIPLPSHPNSHSPQDVAPDVIIEYGKTPETLTNPKSKGLRFQAGEGEFLLRVDGVARYYVQDGRRVTIMPETGSGNDDILVFLMGSALGALLHQRNILALHAAAIAVNGGSVIFSGPSGIGKSTVAAGFHQRGYPFLADDVCAITTTNRHPAVLPGFPRLKLWADCLKKIEQDKNKLKSIRWGKGLEKYFLPVERIQDTPVPIKAVFILGSTNRDNMEINVLKAGGKIDPILNNTYRLRFLEGLGGKRDHFQQCADVASKAAVYRAVRPDKGFRLQELLDLIEKRFLS